MAHGPLKPDSWYIKQGIKPPERIVHHGSDNPTEDGHLHDWSQRGPYLHCAEAKGYDHGIPFDHLKFRFAGTDENGVPILKPIKLANQDELDKQSALADDRRESVARA